MALFFRPILGDRDGLHCEVFSRVVDGVMELGKVLEHAWWNNKFCNAVSEKLYKNPSRLCWTGDYVDCEDLDIPVWADTSPTYIPSFKEVWGEAVRPIDLSSTDFTLDDKYFVNHDSKEYIDLNQYQRDSYSVDNGVSHPVPLLTMIGNEWDWYGVHVNNDKVPNKFYYIGRWRWCVISIEDEPPEGYKKIEVCFPIDNVV